MNKHTILRKLLELKAMVDNKKGFKLKTEFLEWGAKVEPLLAFNRAYQQQFSVDLNMIHANLSAQTAGPLADRMRTTLNKAIKQLEHETDTAEIVSTRKETIMKVFVSHSSADKAIAETFVELVRAALNLSSKDIRCTSIAGYKLPAGADSNKQLRSEVFGCELFIALLSPTSMKSVYVMFELGARWGTNKHLAPIMVAGTQPSDLKPPLSGIHSIDGTSESDLHQLLADMGTKLSTPVEGAATYGKALHSFIDVSSVNLKAAEAKVTKPTDEFVEARGALFKRKPGVGYHEVVYCPNCKMPLSSFGGDFPYGCDRCQVYLDFFLNDVPTILKELP